MRERGRERGRWMSNSIFARSRFRASALSSDRQRERGVVNGAESKMNVRRFAMRLHWFDVGVCGVRCVQTMKKKSIAVSQEHLTSAVCVRVKNRLSSKIACSAEPNTNNQNRNAFSFWRTWFNVCNLVPKQSKRNQKRKTIRSKMWKACGVRCLFVVPPVWELVNNRPDLLCTHFWSRSCSGLEIFQKTDKKKSRKRNEQKRDPCRYNHCWQIWRHFVRCTRPSVADEAVTVEEQHKKKYKNHRRSTTFYLFSTFIFVFFFYFEFFGFFFLLLKSKICYTNSACDLHTKMRNDRLIFTVNVHHISNILAVIPVSKHTTIPNPYFHCQLFFLFFDSNPQTKYPPLDLNTFRSHKFQLQKDESIAHRTSAKSSENAFKSKTQKHELRWHFCILYTHHITQRLKIIIRFNSFTQTNSVFT